MDYDRILDLVGQVAVLKYYLGAACDYADGDHVPPRSAVARWRGLAGVDGAAGVVGCRGDDDGARRDERTGAENPGRAGSTPGAPSSSEVGRG